MTAAKNNPEPGALRRVLVYENRKSGDPYLLDASTEELEAGAFLKLFEVLDDSWQVYGALKEATKPRTPLEGPVRQGRVEPTSFRQPSLTPPSTTTRTTNPTDSW
jgi:hypothetical protein